MEGLTVVDGQSYARLAGYRKPKGPRQASPRLPTPENSRSSDEAFDQSPVAAAATLSETVLRTSNRNGVRGGPVVHDYHQKLHGREGHNGSAYTSGMRESQKPSLPSLKTVLGDKIKSPPRTPSPEDVTVQPLPREPSYVNATYMPPSLYPNKKQRTEPFQTTSQYFHGDRKLTLEPLGSALTMKPDINFGPLSAPAPNSDRHRASQAHSSPSWTARPPPQQTYSNHDPAAKHYRTPEQTPTSTTLEPSFPRISTSRAQDPFARELRDSFAQSSERPDARRASTTAYGSHSTRPYDIDGPLHHAYQPNARHPMPGHDSYPEGRRQSAYSSSEDPARSQGAYGQTSCQPHVPAFFMPSHYEYQHGKARKRSNLPKQSTEIMKTWFDQNMTNPYPSEEQKAMFSNATGISMTQVSNWFINHRRRCPELRDKREKNRNGRDGDT